ncbi:hypothetical protein SIM91_05715 [Rhodococcus opacus]|uniref:Uncharacterized protein n=1 Tax=Rhodococcus artemisiae TaxID=714159 RepID=A0ABU7LL91_9NOCA|nr:MULTISPECIES: hypothetical protein [Rhodococcus]ELB87135.1 hypothetical protein Rwratislav_41425 [Rhodococcus wratislaviensis IFP 2016]MDX5962811.1 hypothetical protein [Rhodococcus opacus]MEE2062344.1 hypothetical protein [Rhodococcus artemisiae]CAG7637638.1 hypothetical protein E143388_07914 [Rhodococcus opacus]
MTRPEHTKAMAAAIRVDVQVVQLAAPVLIRRAIAHYNARLAPGKRPAETTSSEAFLKRLCVNWLRHTGSNYDAHRNGVRTSGGQRLSETAGSVIKKRVLVEIVRVYPWLADEARRQYRELDQPSRH